MRQLRRRLAQMVGGWSRSCLRLLGPAELFSHHTSAGGLLQLANTLYGRRPPAWQLLVTAHGMGLSTELTPATKALLPELLAAVRRWCSGDA